MSDWWEVLFRQTVDCYPDNKPEGMHACEQLLSVPGLPAEIELWTRRNQTWYCRALSEMGTVTKIDFPVRDGWSLFNPSIAINPKGDLRAIVRSSNYWISDDGHYIMTRSDDQVIRTENYLLDLRQVWRGRIVFHWDIPVLIPALDMPNKSGFPVDGLEDARLFYQGGEWQCIGTVRSLNDRGICQQVHVELSGPYDTVWFEVSRARDEHNKNWMPVGNERGWTYIDRCYPTILRDVVGECPTMEDAPYIARSFRGGAAIQVQENTLAVVHEAIEMEPYQKIYTHRFILIDNGSGDPDGPGETLVKVSDPFVFEDRQIEFCAGMAQLGDDLVLSYGVRDEEAHLLRIPLAEAMDMLREPLSEDVP